MDDLAARVDAGQKTLVVGQTGKQVHLTTQGGRKIGMEPEVPGGNAWRTQRIKIPLLNLAYLTENPGHVSPDS